MSKTGPVLDKMAEHNSCSSDSTAPAPPPQRPRAGVVLFARDERRQRRVAVITRAELQTRAKLRSRAKVQKPRHARTVSPPLAHVLAPRSQPARRNADAHTPQKRARPPLRARERAPRMKAARRVRAQEADHDPRAYIHSRDPS
jgi:hypothetical protein